MMRDPVNLGELPDVARRFELGGSVESIDPYGSGNINDTFAVSAETPEGPRRFILQRINDEVFRDPEALMQNVRRVLEHLGRSDTGRSASDSLRRRLELVLASDGRAWTKDDEGHVWRAYRFIEGAVSLPVVGTEEQAFSLGAAVGDFQARLLDFEGPMLYETIPGFHDARRRLAAFERAVAEDPEQRVRFVSREIAFLRSEAPGLSYIQECLETGRLPERVCHNDAKAENVLMDADTGEALCLIDLDTVMPGSALYDFGDLVRSSVLSVPEDHPDGDDAEMRLPIFAGLVEGYLSEAGVFLSPLERDLLVLSGKTITLVMATRFLTDYLLGDKYFKIARPDQNLDRARTQLALSRAMDARRSDMERTVKASSARGGLARTRRR